MDGKADVAIAREGGSACVNPGADADENLQDQVRYARNRIDQLLKQAAREPQ